MKLKSCTAALLLTFCIACTPNESKSADAGVDQTPDIIAQAGAQKPVEEPTATDDGIKEMGLLKEVEDSGYPFATLTIEFPERKFKEYFTINFEEVKGASLDKVYKWVGKYVSFTYNTDLTNALLDVQIGGKSLVSDEKIELGPEVKQLSGILKGADEETPGDLPGEVTITTKNKTTMTFPFFVTTEMVKANGKSVVGFYEERNQNTITAIKLLPK
ncbi:hypothetical protein [Runella slithyformis]|uniref:Uncharacterized protein n=1 Tax=Runella slithyformis (strain ATCC 29530 / DSM 19594 / LMG 11500 / NCIMB 11436 / LSU 4) TaxID=761193 RepID=A0A7U3ZJB6_RUNSL|nr:hypothetical protein [Runella slithyformis]AEI48274.1 hypothetical protein Runsl_1850 [Runella slithyformis DSM 19594]